MAESATKKRKLEGEEDDTPVASLDDVMQLIILWGMNPADFNDACSFFSPLQNGNIVLDVTTRFLLTYTQCFVHQSSLLTNPSRPQIAHQTHRSNQPSEPSQTKSSSARCWRRQARSQAPPLPPSRLKTGRTSRCGRSLCGTDNNLHHCFFDIDILCIRKQSKCR